MASAPFALGEQRRDCPRPGLGASLTRTSSSSATPAPVRAETKQTGTRWPSRNAFSNGACSCAGAILALLEVERHQVLVDLDHLVDERAVRVGDRREIGVAGRIEEAVDDTLAAVGRQVDRQAFLAERCLDRARAAPGRSTFSASMRLMTTRRHRRRFAAHSIMRDVIICDAGGRVDDDRRGLDRVERADRLADEVGEARACRSCGRACPAVSRCRQRRAQRVLVGLLERIEVADRAAALDAADAGIAPALAATPRRASSCPRRRLPPAPRCGCSRSRTAPWSSSGAWYALSSQ